MNSISCVIIDPSASDRDLLNTLISRMPNMRIVGSFKDPIESIGVIHAQKVKLIFMELDILGINGVDFAKLLPDTAYTIITTNSKYLAVEAYEFGAIDYLVKPLSLLRLIKAINRAMKYINNYEFAKAPRREPSHEELYIKSGRDLVRITTPNIVYIEASGPLSKVFIIKQKEPLIVNIMLSDLMTLLPNGEFLRVHKSYIISISRIVAVNSLSIDLDNIRIPIGATYRKSVFSFLRADPVIPPIKS